MQASLPAEAVQRTHTQACRPGHSCSPSKGSALSLFHDLALDTGALMQAWLAITLLGLHGGRYLEAVAAVPAHRKKQPFAEMCTASRTARERTTVYHRPVACCISTWEQAQHCLLAAAQGWPAEQQCRAQSTAAQHGPWQALGKPDRSRGGSCKALSDSDHPEEGQHANQPVLDGSPGLSARVPAGVASHSCKWSGQEGTA